MVAKRKKKYSTGEGAQFMTRKAALKKLQLSLNDFRRLCILKGIYPREPRNRKRAQKGHTVIKTLYHVKDIQFLLHEPIIWTLRDYKIFYRKVGRARAIKDFEKMNRYLSNHPTLKLDHIVKERYPTFIDALRDLDDCLTLCFLFSTFPSIQHVPRNQSILCRRLTMEFLHAVIEAKALRKVFISIKGYYYQAELKGETITWVVPHHFAFEPQQKSEVDFKLMSTFVEFYTILLGFVNFRLYHSLNLLYPPKFSTSLQDDVDKSLVDEEAFVSERVCALNYPLLKSSNNVEDEVEIDNFNTNDSPEQIEEAKKEAEKINKLKTLFKGLKFFLNREVPREPLVFIIRCFGGEVSWDKTLFVGATFDESEDSITHQIVDRPSMPSKVMTRFYIQPQWVFDCVNQRELLPEKKYLMGEVLPPHLSPFNDPTRDQQYIPPEERALHDETLLAQHNKDEEQEENGEEESEDDEEEANEEIEQADDKEEDNEEEDDIEEEAQDSPSTKKPKLSVATGELYKEVPWEKDRQERQAYKLREKMIPKKHRKLYKSMMEGKQKRAKEIWLLRKKRREHDKKEAEAKKASKKLKKTNKA